MMKAKLSPVVFLLHTNHPNAEMYVCVLEEMTFPCAQNVEVMHLDFPWCLLCGFLIADVHLSICVSFWTHTYCIKPKTSVGQEEAEPVGSKFGL